jgi:hypothetical protein
LNVNADGKRQQWRHRAETASGARRATLMRLCSLRTALALASIQRTPSSIMLARSCSISVGDAGRPVIILCIARTPSNEGWTR